MNDDFLAKSSGVIHVGAHIGQEVETYGSLGLPVIWIEANPDLIERLKSNISKYTNQRSIQGLVSDVNDSDVMFHVSSNDGASSSILDLGLHEELHPSVVYVDSIVLKTSTLPTLLKAHEIDLRKYNALVIDTQGSELLVLKGAVEIIGAFKFIRVEVADFESYVNGCQLPDIQLFMKENGFSERSRIDHGIHFHAGNYYDIIYENIK